MIARVRRWFARSAPVTLAHVARLDAADNLVADTVDDLSARLQDMADQYAKTVHQVEQMQAVINGQQKQIVTLQQQRLTDIYGRP